MPAAWRPGLGARMAHRGTAARDRPPRESRVWRIRVNLTRRAATTSSLLVPKPLDVARGAESVAALHLGTRLIAKLCFAKANSPRSDWPAIEGHASGLDAAGRQSLGVQRNRVAGTGAFPSATWERGEARYAGRSRGRDPSPLMDTAGYGPERIRPRLPLSGRASSE